MPLEQARVEITTGVIAPVDSDDGKLLLSWLSGKESKIRDDREKKILLWCIISAIAASIAALLAFIGMFR